MENAQLIDFRFTFFCPLIYTTQHECYKRTILTAARS
jgi:hypothetical protein